MVIGSTLCQLGRFLDEWAGDVASVRSVTVSDEAGLGAGESITAEVTLEMPVVVSGGSDRMVGCTPSVRDGVLELRLETGLSVTEHTGDYEVDIEPVEATPHTDGTATVTVSLTLSGIDGAGSDELAADRQGSAPQVRSPPEEREEIVRDPDAEAETESRDIPPFRDPELLQEVYDAHDTFAEMADALEMDVTGETVRRYMIDHDIHQPNSYRANSAPASTTPAESTVADDQEEMVVLSDGIGLPDGVSVEDLIETVSRSNTIYEVKEDLDLERMEAHAMLKELNMVDLVLGRLSNDTGRDITREDVVERLREVSQAQTN